MGQARRTAILEIQLLEPTSSAVVRARRLALNNSAPEEWRWKTRTADDDPFRVYLKSINGCILRPVEQQAGCSESNQETDASAPPPIEDGEGFEG